MRGNSARSLKLEGVRISHEQLLGARGDEIWYVFNVIAPIFLMAMAGTYLGLAQAGLDELRRHLLGRQHTHSGTTLADTAVVQHTFGELWAETQRARALILHAAQAADFGDSEALGLLCSAKAEVAEAATHVIGTAMRLMGGRGYFEGARVHRLYRDAAAAHVMAPTTDVLRVWTARAALGLVLLGD